MGNGQPKGSVKLQKRFVVVMTALFMVIALLVYNMGLYVAVRREIGEHNQKVIQDCLLLKCDVTPFGDVRCETTQHASDIVGNDTWVFPVLNRSGV